MASKTADDVPEPTDQQTPDPVTAGTDETPKDDKAVDTRNDDPTINPAPNAGPDAPTGDSAVEAFPDQDEVLTSDPGKQSLKTTKVETSPSDQSGEPIEIEVVEDPTLPVFKAFKSVSGVLKISRVGWIGPEALEVAPDELKELKKFVASL